MKKKKVFPGFISANKSATRKVPYIMDNGLQLDIYPNLSLNHKQ